MRGNIAIPPPAKINTVVPPTVVPPPVNINTSEMAMPVGIVDDASVMYEEIEFARASVQMEQREDNQSDVHKKSHIYHMYQMFHMCRNIRCTICINCIT